MWDATLRNLGVLKLAVADKAAGQLETETFPFTFTVGKSPAAPERLVRPAAWGAREASRLWLAQDGNSGKATQVLWFSTIITVRRPGATRTGVLVIPRIHESLLTGFIPGSYNSPWGDLFAKIHGFLGGR